MAKKKMPHKPMDGPRIQQMCPAQNGWRVLLLELDDDDSPVMDDEGDPKHSLVDIAFWALFIEEGQSIRYQDMLPCVPTAEGTLEPVDPADPCFIAIVTPAEKENDIAQMVEDYVAEFLKEDEEVDEINPEVDDEE